MRQLGEDARQRERERVWEEVFLPSAVSYIVCPSSLDHRLGKNDDCHASSPCSVGVCGVDAWHVTRERHLTPDNWYCARGGRLAWRKQRTGWSHAPHLRSAREKCLSDKMLVIIADTFRGTHQTANSAPSLNESLGALNTRLTYVFGSVYKSES